MLASITQDLGHMHNLSGYSEDSEEDCWPSSKKTTKSQTNFLATVGACAV